MPLEQGRRGLWQMKRYSNKGGMTMNRIRLGAFKGLAVVCLLSSPGWTSGEADVSWTTGIRLGREVTMLAKAWRPQGLKPLPVVTNYLDLGQLGRKLNELESNLKMSTDCAEHPFVGLGFFFDEQRPTVINSILIDGNAEQA